MINMLKKCSTSVQLNRTAFFRSLLLSKLVLYQKSEIRQGIKSVQLEKLFPNFGSFYLSLFYPVMCFKFALFDVIYVLLLQLIELENMIFFFEYISKKRKRKMGPFIMGALVLVVSPPTLSCATQDLSQRGCSFQAHFENKSTTRK